MSKGPELPHGMCITVAYDGTDFHGWQAQPGLRTVQGTIEEALDAMGLRHSIVRGCSRTDAGVHAEAQVAAFACEREIEPRGWIPALNQSLPDDVVVKHARACFYRYNPRFHGLSKRYRYLLQNRDVRDPLMRRRAWRTWHQLDYSAMETAAAHFVGTHNFQAFKAAGDDREGFERTMHSVELTRSWHGREDLTAVEIVGNAFLKHMVRIMTGTLIDVGRGKLSPDDVPGMLAPGARRTMAGQTAPAHGLTLIEIEIDRVLGPADFFGKPT